MRHISHDVRGAATPIRNAAHMIRMRLEDDCLANLIERGVNDVVGIVSAAVEEEPTPCAVAEFHAAIADAVRHIREEHGEAARIELADLPPDIAEYRVPVNKACWNSIMRNLVANAMLKEAKRIRVDFRRAKFQRSHIEGVEVSVLDDGMGMSPEALEKISSGQRYTDKAPGAGLRDGDSLEHHGFGLQSTRRFIQELSLGEMDVLSAERTADAPESGTSIMLRIPFINGEHKKAAATETETSRTLPSELSKRRIDRRRMIGLLTGGAAAGAFGVIGAVGHLSRSRRVAQAPPKREPDAMAEPASPLKELRVDEQGRIASLRLDLGGRTLTFVRGRPHPDVGNVHTIDLQGASALSFHLQHEGRSHEVCLCHLPEGLVARVLAVTEHAHHTGYLCMPQREGKPLETDTGRFYRLSDTVFNGHFAASNIDLFRGEALAPFTERLSRLLRQQPGLKEERQALNAVRRAVEPLLTAHTRSRADALVIRTPDEWLQHAGTARGKVLIVEPPALTHVREHALSAQETAGLRMRQNTLCLRGVLPEEAQRFVRL